jgi:hypothetical protein
MSVYCCKGRVIIGPPIPVLLFPLTLSYVIYWYMILTGDTVCKVVSCQCQITFMCHWERPEFWLGTLFYINQCILYCILYCRLCFNSVDLLMVHVLYSMQVSYTCYLSLMFKIPNIVYEHICAWHCIVGYALMVMYQKYYQKHSQWSAHWIVISFTETI